MGRFPAWCWGVLALFCSAGMLAAGPVRFETLDRGTNGISRFKPSLATVNGNPAMAYHNFSEGTVTFARNTAADGSGSWVTTTLGASIVDSGISLAVINGKPAISYVSRERTGLKVSYICALDSDGATWGLPVVACAVENEAGIATSLALVDGRPAIASSRQEGARYTIALDSAGAAWKAPIELTGLQVVTGVRFISLVIAGGNPAICYEGGTQTYFARSLDAEGNQWGAGAPVFPGTAYFAYALVVNGNPAVVATVSSGLQYVRAIDSAGTAWGTPVALDASGEFLHGISLVNGSPAAVYSAGEVIKYVRALDANGGTWAAPVDSGARQSGGLRGSLVLASGRPAIAFQGTTTRDLRFVRASNSSGTGWPGSTVVDSGVNGGNVGSQSVQMLVNGCPATVYFDETNQALKYTRANDAAGLSWGNPVVLVSSGLAAPRPAIAIIGGSPAVTYLGSGGTVQFLRSADANGAAWGAPVQVSQHSSPSAPRLIAANGRPAIALRTEQGICYVRASNSTGTGWPGMTIISGGTDILRSLGVVNGSPAIVYGNSSVLKYLQAGDVNGASWAGSPQTVANGFTEDAALAIVDGRPAIAYTAQPEVKYVRANDTNGASWGSPVTVFSSVGDFGLSVSLAVIAGRPEVAFCRNSGIHVVQSKDAQGAVWGASQVVEFFGPRNPVSLIVANGQPALSYYDFYRGDLKWAALQPDLAVTQSVALQDGVGVVDFGTITPGSASASRTFTLANVGYADLTGLTVAMTGSSDFSFPALSGASILNQGAPVGLTVTFNPTGTGPRSATLHITSNDPDQNPFDIALVGRGNSVPQLTLPAATVVVEATSSAGATTAFTVAATDAEDGALAPVVSHPSGTIFPIGFTTVNVSATDAAGVTATDSFQVRVVDTTPPVIHAPAAINVPATMPSGAPVTFSVSANDLVGLEAVTTSAVSGSVFPPGTTTVTIAARDLAGNVATGSFPVTVTPLNSADSWRYTYFGSTEDSGSAVFSADADFDGLSNLLEYSTLR